MAFCGCSCDEWLCAAAASRRLYVVAFAAAAAHGCEMCCVTDSCGSASLAAEEAVAGSDEV